jgi:hypothetical protein
MTNKHDGWVPPVERPLVGVKTHGVVEGTMSREVCTFRYDHDPATLAPRGRACKMTAIEEIFWKDGRTSVACKDHGVDALTDDAKAEVLRVAPLAPKKRRK